jgi:hypothetical protein
MLGCESNLARAWETHFKSKLLNFEVFDDDTYLDPFIGLTPHRSFVPFNLPVKREHTNGLGHHFVTQITDLETDGHLLKKSAFLASADDLDERINATCELFNGAIDVKAQGFSLYACLTQDIIHLMDMETLFIQIYDNPDLFIKMINSLADDYLEWFDLMAQKNVLHPTFEGQWLGNGANCFASELPRSGKSLTSKDVWGFMDSQETVGMSPQMFEEFIFPAYKKVADHFGLLSYGCCEPVHSIWDNCLSKLPNLRKLSISPWCDEEFIGERLAGTKVIYLRKPSPNFLGVDVNLDEDNFRKHIRKTLDATKGCTVEFSQRDVYTVHKNPNKVRRYVEIIREEF